MSSIIFVTQNLNKVRDAQQLLPGIAVEHVDFDIPEIQSLDVKEVIEHKLTTAYARLFRRGPFFVMDAALAFDCLNGFPGPMIKYWFEKTVGEEKTCQIATLFNEYGCTWTHGLGYFDGAKSHFFVEETRGHIAESPRGDNGFHWDRIFIPEGETRTFAEMTFEEKQSFAPTGRLFKTLSSLISDIP